MATNIVLLIGRLTKDPEVSYRGQDQTAVATFNLAIDRYVKGGEKKVDYPRIIVFGRQAENCEKYLRKGSQVAVNGRIQTGSYEKNGSTVYTTDVVASNIEYLSKAESSGAPQSQASLDDVPSGFMPYESSTDDIPF